VPAKSLKVGDRLLNNRKNPVNIVSIAKSTTPVPVPVFNMTVAGQHTFLVGDSGIIVHNKSFASAVIVCGKNGQSAPGPGGGGPSNKNYNDSRSNTAVRRMAPGGGPGLSGKNYNDGRSNTGRGILPSGKAIKENGVQIAFSPAGNGSPSCVCPLGNIGSSGQDGVHAIGSTGNDGVDFSNLGSTGNDGVLTQTPIPQSGCCGGGAMPPGLMFAPAMFLGWKRRLRKQHELRQGR
jgi:hypothetical protein